MQCKTSSFLTRRLPSAGVCVRAQAAARPVVGTPAAAARSAVVARAASSTLPSSTIQGAPQPRRVLAPTTPSVFAGLESFFARTFNNQRLGQRSDWEEVEGNWVLRPPHGAQPQAVVHFLGGAFVGAAPQLSYRLLLEALASRNVLVITTPYGTSFEQLRVVDEVWYKFDRCCKALQEEVGRLPVYGVGHSQGALLHMLLCSRYSVKRAGNALLAYNNRPATDVIPFLSPFIAPPARAVGPLLAQLAASPLRSSVEALSDGLRGLSPSLLRQLMPLLEQLTPIYMDVAQGRQEFLPAPEEAKNLLLNYYTVPRNLLVRFKDDSIDETIELASLLQSSATLSQALDVNVRTLSGDHIRPLTQAIVDLPPEVARLANEAVVSSGAVIGRLADLATQAGLQQAGALEDMAHSVSDMASVFGGQVGGPVADGMQALADEVAAWMGVNGVVVSGVKALPATAVRSASPAERRAKNGTSSTMQNGLGFRQA